MLFINSIKNSKKKMNGNKPIHSDIRYCIDRRQTTLRAAISRRSIVPALPAHSSLCTKITGTIAHPGPGRSTCSYFRAKALGRLHMVKT
jgi:hypothetical protein